VRKAQPGCHLDLLAHDASDPVAELRLIGKHLPHGRGILVGTYQDHGLQEVPVRPLLLEPPPEAPSQHDYQEGGGYRALHDGRGGYGCESAGEPAGGGQHAPADGCGPDYPDGLTGELRAHGGPVQAGHLNHGERRNGSRYRQDYRLVRAQSVLEDHRKPPGQRDRGEITEEELLPEERLGSGPPGIDRRTRVDDRRYTRAERSRGRRFLRPTRLPSFGPEDTESVIEAMCSPHSRLQFGSPAFVLVDTTFNGSTEERSTGALKSLI
jgi:hypothetical protein